MNIATMTGTVTGRAGPYYVVECPNAPSYLNPLYLAPSHMAGASVGSRVKLAYRTTALSGLWYVVEVLS